MTRPADIPAWAWEKAVELDWAMAPAPWNRKEIRESRHNGMVEIIARALIETRQNTFEEAGQSLARVLWYGDDTFREDKRFMAAFREFIERDHSIKIEADALIPKEDGNV